MGKAKKTLPDMERMPKHVAIIMDGNGRWAKKNKLKVALGHRKGVETLRAIIRESSDLGIDALTLYAFSTENWKRSPEEVGALMDLLLEFFTSEIDELDRENVRILILGDVDAMPEKQRDALCRAMERTESNTGLHLNIAINYGGRAELARAAKLIAQDVCAGALSADDINESLIANYLYTRNLPDVDLMIRTSGEMRLSNFLLYQCAYAEFDFPSVLWPDYTLEEYHASLYRFGKRERRFGGR